MGKSQPHLPTYSFACLLLPMDWAPFLWLAATLALLLLVERWIHRHLQGVMLLFTGDPEIAVMLYALPLLPGIILHELSHAFAASLLGVRVGRISIRPKRAGQRVQLGFVPIEDWVFGLGTIEGSLAAGAWGNLITALPSALRASDAWIWAYLIFAVSNTMLPSRADRQAWRPIILFLLLVGVLIWIAGLGPAIIAHLANPLTMALRWLATMCAITIVVDLPFALLIALVEKLLERGKGWRVDYQA
jgi:hypothetical protein